MKLTDYLVDVAHREQLARALKINEQYLYQIETGRRQAGPKLALEIERQTSGEVTASDLRPDIFGKPSKKAA
jgi:DNA-binding transcriptional regulator YdaS (Cro superfamily)